MHKNNTTESAPVSSAREKQPSRRDLIGLLLSMGLPLTVASKALAQPVRPDQNVLKHFLYFHHRGDDGAALRTEPALQDQRFSGAQVAYSWRSLEPTPGQFDFSAIEADRDYLQTLGKPLWVQLQDKSFRRAPTCRRIC